MTNLSETAKSKTLISLVPKIKSWLKRSQRQTRSSDLLSEKRQSMIKRLDKTNTKHTHNLEKRLLEDMRGNRLLLGKSKAQTSQGLTREATHSNLSQWILQLQAVTMKHRTGPDFRMQSMQDKITCSLHSF